FRCLEAGIESAVAVARERPWYSPVAIREGFFAMPNQDKDALMAQAVSAFTQGCGTAQINADAHAWFHQRYHPWIDKRKATGKTPQDVWDTDGAGFLDKFRQIGSQAVKDGIVSAESLNTAATGVEQTSDCPYCPDKP